MLFSPIVVGHVSVNLCELTLRNGKVNRKIQKVRFFFTPFSENPDPKDKTLRQTKNDVESLSV